MLRVGLVRLLSQQADVQSQLLASSALPSIPAAAAAAVTAVIQQQQPSPQHYWLHACFGSWQLQRQLHTTICAAAPVSQHVVQLDRLRPAPGSSKLVSDTPTTACLLYGLNGAAHEAARLAKREYVAHSALNVERHVHGGIRLCAEQAVGAW